MSADDDIELKQSPESTPPDENDPLLPSPANHDDPGADAPPAAAGEPDTAQPIAPATPAEEREPEEDKTDEPAREDEAPPNTPEASRRAA